MSDSGLYFTYGDWTVDLSVSRYVDDPVCMAVLMNDLDDQENSSMPITVNLGVDSGNETIMPRNCAYLDENNYPGLGQTLEKFDIARPYVRWGVPQRKQSGFVSYPLYEFNEYALESFDPEGYARYADGYDDAFKTVRDAWFGTEDPWVYEDDVVDDSDHLVAEADDSDHLVGSASDSAEPISDVSDSAESEQNSDRWTIERLADTRVRDWPDDDGLTAAYVESMFGDSDPMSLSDTEAIALSKARTVSNKRQLGELNAMSTLQKHLHDEIRAFEKNKDSFFSGASYLEYLGYVADADKRATGEVATAEPASDYVVSWRQDWLQHEAMSQVTDNLYDLATQIYDGCSMVDIAKGADQLTSACEDYVAVCSGTPNVMLKDAQKYIGWVCDAVGCSQAVETPADFSAVHKQLANYCTVHGADCNAAVRDNESVMCKAFAEAVVANDTDYAFFSLKSGGKNVDSEAKDIAKALANRSVALNHRADSAIAEALTKNLDATQAFALGAMTEKEIIANTPVSKVADVALRFDNCLMTAYTKAGWADTRGYGELARRTYEIPEEFPSNRKQPSSLSSSTSAQAEDNIDY